MNAPFSYHPGPYDEEQARSKAAILVEREKLLSMGIKFVAVHFDGSCDDGATEEVKCYDSDYYEYYEHEPLAHKLLHLQQHFENLVPFGYENGCGGFGDVVFDVEEGKITVIRNDRFEDYTTNTYEV